jgi:hypothetical protein
MENTNSIGWEKLISGYPWYNGEGKFSLPAYSEFMPSPKLGFSPYGDLDKFLFDENDLYGWNISELEEESELKPGMEHIGKQVMHYLLKLGKGETEFHISGHGGQNFKDNPYWPEELSKYAGKLEHERYMVFLPFALSRTQDDKGRVRWTLFGGSEQGPERVFWNSFKTSPEQEIPEKDSLSFITRILANAYGEKIDGREQLFRAGFKILPHDTSIGLPDWTKPFTTNQNAGFENVKYLLTFKPFSLLPEKAKEKYLNGTLALLPFPGSLVFWGMPTYQKLSKHLQLAVQIPLLKLVARHSGHGGIKVPQSGWLHEPHPNGNGKQIEMHKELVHDTYHRTHRWQRVHRHDDELLQQPRLARLIKVLFSTDLDTMGLYDKPMARNCQLWTNEFELVINGPKAKRADILKAETELAKGGLFGYRFLFPPMRVGRHEVYWHRPMVAYLSKQTNEFEMFTESLLGYLTAYDNENIDISKPIELWPRLLQRPIYLKSLHSFDSRHDHYAHQAAMNIMNLFDAWQMHGKKPLARFYARHLIRIAKHETLEQWLDSFAEKAKDIESAKQLRKEIENILEPVDKPIGLPNPITFSFTSGRAFEEAWWNDIHYLAHGQFINKDNADCVQDEITLSKVPHKHRDLEQLGDYLINRHRGAIAKAGMEGKAFCGELPFEWRTDFSFDVFGGWRRNQEKHTYERNILVVIPGKNRNEAVVMGDHYDTAYMEDVFEVERGGSGARISANGADDNYSATSTLLQAAPIFLQLSKEGKLERDVWLIHLTGEEFPSDCLGARNFCEALIERTLKLKFGDGQYIDLSNTKIAGAFVMDMIGHNKDSDQDIFQISPGKSVQSLKIAHEAHIANLLWNTCTHEWNKSNERLHLNRGKRIIEGQQIPEISKHLSVFGEVRTHYDPHSSIYNTDGQIFSDIGAPIVLFMENYDLHRTGYHDTKDTMENIDLDYGAAIAAICIEAAARVAVVPEL